MIYRLATPEDNAELVRFALDALQRQKTPGLLISPSKVEACVRHFTSTEGDFQQVAVQDGRIVAAVAALVTEMPFFERCEAHIYFCWSVVPGAGMRLMRSLMAWFKADFRLRRLVWAMNEGARPMQGLAARLGFHATTDLYVARKGAR